MKFATRISSIRRQAWKQCRSCSADSDSMCADSLARYAARGVDALALGLEHARDRVLREPVDVEVRVQPAQLLGDRDVAARVAEADRGGDEQRAAAPASDAAPAAVPPANSYSSRLTSTGLRACGPWPEPAIVTRRPPVASASAAPWACGRIRSSSPWITSTGHCTRADRVLERLEPAQGQRRHRVRERLRVGLQRPAHAVLDLLGRVRVVEHLGEEELQEPAVVLAPVVAVVHRPAGRWRRAGPPRSGRRSPAPGGAGASGTAGPM